MGVRGQVISLNKILSVWLAFSMELASTFNLHLAQQLMLRQWYNPIFPFFEFSHLKKKGNLCHLFTLRSMFEFFGFISKYLKRDKRYFKIESEFGSGFFSELFVLLTWHIFKGLCSSDRSYVCSNNLYLFDHRVVPTNNHDTLCVSTMCHVEHLVLCKWYVRFFFSHIYTVTLGHPILLTKP